MFCRSREVAQSSYLEEETNTEDKIFLPLPDDWRRAWQGSCLTALLEILESLLANFLKVAACSETSKVVPGSCSFLRAVLGS